MAASSSAESSLSNAPVTRLAPSPTGVLHLGNARTFVLNWLWARALGGTVALRIENIDGPRVKPAAEAAALADLEWLGLDWDGPVVRQSERLEVYAAAAERLVTAGRAYPCVCTRKEIEDAASAPHEDWMDATPYPGTCRDRWPSIAAAREATGRDPALRFRIEDRCEAVPFADLFVGSQPGPIRGDFVIAKRDGGPAYQLAVVVDDAAFGVTDVVRGDDLLPSTPRQLLLYDALGWSRPRFGHLPLVVGPDGRRLAKRHGDTSLRFFRERGVECERLLGYLARLSGLDVPERISLAELLDAFDPRCLTHVERVVATGRELLDR